MKGTANEDVIFKFTNEILKVLNNKTLVGSIFCDLEKAFDSVNHDILLSKLSYYGISGKAKSLLKSYLQNRYQRVLITNALFNSNTVSKWTKITCGVPQGSILGPLLFLLYIKNLPKAVKHKALPILFADNTSILITSPNSNQLQSALNTVFAQLNKWFKSNLLFLNLDKTHFIQFNNASKCTSFTENKYEEEQISIANETKFLGLYINDNLSWKTHIETIKNKLRSASYVMMLVKPYVTAKTLKRFTIRTFTL